MESELAQEIRDFISRHIGSVERLEVLLLLYRSPERNWSVAAVSQELRSSEIAVTRSLNMLVASQLAAAYGDGFRFQPSTPALLRETELVAATYRVRPVKVIECIYRRPNPQLLDFSEAFKLRKRP